VRHDPVVRDDPAASQRGRESSAPPIFGISIGDDNSVCAHVFGVMAAAIAEIAIGIMTTAARNVFIASRMQHMRSHQIEKLRLQNRIGHLC
jgi:hypothetical protein